MNFITVAFFYFPETEPTSVQFENGGIESHFMILELKLLFYMFCIHLFLVIVHAILAIFKRCLPARLQRAEISLRNYLYWNGLIRFFMEAYVDFTLLGLLNIQKLDWNGAFSAVTLCNYFAVITVVALCVCPFILGFFFCFKYSKWNDEKFLGTYGSYLEGADVERKEKRWLIGFLP